MNTKSIKENRKEEIFTSAVQCFNENGYYKTSMDMIAERTGMTKRGLYYHFKSKDQLFIELFHYMNKKYYERIPAFATRITDPEKRLRMFVNIAAEVLHENTDFLKFSQEFMSISVRKPEIRKVMMAYYREQVDKVRATLEEGIRIGAFKSVDAGKMARAFVLITLGVFHVYFSLDDKFDYIEQHAFDIDQMIKALKSV